MCIWYSKCEKQIVCFDFMIVLPPQTKLCAVACNFFENSLPMIISIDKTMLYYLFDDDLKSFQQKHCWFVEFKARMFFKQIFLFP